MFWEIMLVLRPLFIKVSLLLANCINGILLLFYGKGCCVTTMPALRAFSSLPSSQKAFVAQITQIVEPVTYAQACRENNWILAMEKE